MGTDTIRIGTSRMFDMFQHQKLNKRFVYVFLEGVIITLFPQNKFPELFTRLHSQSDRVVNHIAKMKENNVDSSEPGARKRRRWYQLRNWKWSIAQQEVSLVLVNDVHVVKF